MVITRAQVLEEVVGTMLDAVTSAMEQPEMADIRMIAEQLSRMGLMFIGSDKSMRQDPQVAQVLNNRSLRPLQRVSVMGKAMLSGIVRNEKWQEENGSQIDTQLRGLFQLLARYFVGDVDWSAVNPFEEAFKEVGSP